MNWNTYIYVCTPRGAVTIRALEMLFVSFLALLGLAGSSVPLHGLYENCMPAAEHYKNPFDFDTVNLTATVKLPSGGSVTIDGFYYQNYSRSNKNDREILTPEGDPAFCIRYAPVEEGSHSGTMELKDPSGVKKHSFEFSAEKGSDMRGYIRLGRNNLHFQFENNRTYFPVGENICWVRYQQGTYDFDTYFSALAKHGGTYTRLWLTDAYMDGLAVEIAIGVFNLTNLWRLDYVVALAEQLDIRLLMCTESFNLLRSKAPYDKWSTSYLNKANGGILDRPQDFFTDEAAKADYKGRLRYLISRYGYSTSVFAWEYFNEVDITDGYSSTAQVAWIKEMTDWIHGLDTNRHLVSTSYSNSAGDPNVQALDSLDFTMTHSYNENDIAASTAQWPKMKVEKYKKPSYVAEFGIGNENQDKAGWSLHNGLWAPVMQFGAGTCMTWWWDSWVAPNNLYGAFVGVSEFVKLVEWAQYDWMAVENVTTSLNTSRLYLMVGKSLHKQFPPIKGYAVAVLWAQNLCSTWKKHHDGIACSKQSDLAITIPGCQYQQNYEVTWYNTTTGKPLPLETHDPCADGTLKFTAPDFLYDIAGIALIT
ncbi:uncharacterized protein [Oscarella lobularis]|uniref:uncharacterized protein n=1 Tax=Oscarella lobularis TaxID=121494 RepID=UPI0033138C92